MYDTMQNIYLLTSLSLTERASTTDRMSEKTEITNKNRSVFLILNDFVCYETIRNVLIAISETIFLDAVHSQDRQKRFLMWAWPKSPVAANPSVGQGPGRSGWGYLSHSSFYYVYCCCGVLCGTLPSPLYLR